MRRYDAGFLFLVFAGVIMTICPLLLRAPLNAPEQAPRSLETIEFSSAKDFEVEIFVGGAVQREGYYTISAFTDYGQLLSYAGLHDQAAHDLTDGLAVDLLRPYIIIGYTEHGKYFDSININYCSLESLLAADIAEDIAARIISMRPQNGYVSKHALLADEILSDEEYAAIYHKLHALS